MFFIVFLLAGAVAAGQERNAASQRVAAPASPADLVIENARIYTVDPSRPRAEALAVGGGRILAVGSNAENSQTYRFIDATD